MDCSCSVYMRSTLNKQCFEHPCQKIGDTKSNLSFKVSFLHYIPSNQTGLTDTFSPKLSMEKEV